MIRQEDADEAEKIGEDSWWLQHFGQLPKSATCQRQADALRQDREWLRRHCEEVMDRIDQLADRIEARARAPKEEPTHAQD